LKHNTGDEQVADENDYLSLADLEGMQDEELVGVDPTADANALPPPIQPGKYLLKLKHQVEEEGKLWKMKKTSAKSKNPGVQYMSTDLWGEIADNPVNPKEYTGRRIAANNIMTLVMQDGTTGAMAVIQGLGKGAELANGPQTASRQCVMLSKLLAGEPFIGAEIDWEASWYSKEKEEDLHDRKRGAKHFKKGADGKYIPELEVDGDAAEVRPYIRRWLQVSELLTPKTGGAHTDAPVSGAPKADAPPPKSAAAPKPGRMSR
jgi:hypothetical protein